MIFSQNSQFFMFPQVKTQLSLSQRNFLVIDSRQFRNYTGIPKNDSPYFTAIQLLIVIIVICRTNRAAYPKNLASTASIEHMSEGYPET